MHNVSIIKLIENVNMFFVWFCLFSFHNAQPLCKIFVKFFAKFGEAAFVAEKFLVPKVLVPRMTVLYTTTLCGGLVGGYYHCIPGSGGCKGHFKDRSNERKKFF